jgi:hypothetical protein
MSVVRLLNDVSVVCYTPIVSVMSQALTVEHG